MLTLRTFGGLSLSSVGEPTVDCSVPRRTLALLAVLAATPGTAVSREHIATMLWPESDEEASRNSLRQALFRIKQETGVANVVLGNADLRLNEEVVHADIIQFLRAISAREWRQAVDVYAGEFAKGFSLRNGGGFERWCDSTRTALEAQYHSALRQLAEAAHREDRRSDEISWRRRLRDADPLDARSAGELMRAAVRAGDVAEALRAYSHHERMLRSELDLPPHNELIELARTLRQERATGGGDKTRAEAAVHAFSPSDASTTATHDAPATQRPRGVLTRRLGIALAGLSVVTLAVVALVQAKKPSPMDVAMGQRIVVSVAGENEAARALARSLALLVAVRLNGTDEIDFVTENDSGALPEAPDAARFERKLQFEVIRQGPQMHVLGDLGPGPAARRYRFELSADTGTMELLADQCAFRLLPRLVAADLQASVGRAATSTQSLEALKAFVSGERDMRKHRYAPSLIAMQRAVQLDSLFAFAWHRLAEVADWSGHTAMVPDASQRAAALADRLVAHDAELVRATHAWRTGHIDAAEQGLRRVVTEYPQDLEAWYFLGEVQFHSAPYRGRAITRAREAFERAATDDARRIDALKHLARLAAWRGDLAKLQDLETKTAVAADTVLPPILRRPLSTMSLHDSAFDREFEAALRNSNHAPRIWEAADRGAVYTGNVHAAGRAAQILTAPPWSPGAIRAARLYLASLEASRGRFRAADTLLAAADQQLPTTFLMLRGSLALVPWSSLDSQTIRSIYDRLVVWKETPPESQESEDYNGLTPRFRDLITPALAHRLRTGVFARYDAVAPRDSNEASLRYSYSLANAAMVARDRGDKAAALRLLEGAQPVLRTEVATSLLGAHASIRWLRAELLRENGRPSEALEWYGSIVSTTALETPYLAPAHLRSAQILDSLGEMASAQRHYEAFVRTWQHADPPLQPLVIAARDRLRALGRSR